MSSSATIPTTTTDTLFRFIETSQHPTSFGRILDAGTGTHSLKWIAGLIHSNKATSYTAVTADESMRRSVFAEATKLKIENSGDVVIGNWFNSNGKTNGNESVATELCQDEMYDVILADYLVGAMDGFSPYFQDLIFNRLSKHLNPKGRIYVVGLQPIPDRVSGDANVFCKVTKVRDACILLAGHRCYREYPVNWIVRNLQRIDTGLKVVNMQTFSIMYSFHTMLKQLNVARSKLPLFMSQGLASEMGKEIDNLESECREATERSASGKITLGFDYVVVAEKVEFDKVKREGEEEEESNWFNCGIGETS